MIRWLYLFCSCLVVGCKSSTVISPPPQDFEKLSGKESPVWKYVQTPEDFAHLALFKEIFTSSYLPAALSDTPHIPSTLHFIWLGPKPFPRASVENLRSWVAKHPEWTVKFWTDRPRPLPVPGMQYASVHDLPCYRLQDCIRKSDNPAEQSDLLRLEILYREGGI